MRLSRTSNPDEWRVWFLWARHGEKALELNPFDAFGLDFFDQVINEKVRSWRVQSASMCSQCAVLCWTSLQWASHLHLRDGMQYKQCSTGYVKPSGKCIALQADARGC